MSKDTHENSSFDKLKSTRLFSRLPDHVLHLLFSYCQEIELEKNEILFNQNDPSDSLYIVISGYLLALLSHQVNHQHSHLHTIGGIKMGELIGEMGLLSEKPRSSTIKALVKSRLLRLSQESFYKFIKQINSHELFIEISRSIIQRQQSTIKSLSHKEVKEHIFLLKINNETNVTAFIERFSAVFTQHKEFFFCDLQKLSHLYNEHDYTNLLNYIDDIEKDYQTIFYYYTGPPTDLLTIILHRINMIVVMANAKTRPYVSNDYLKFVEDNYFLTHCLVLIWPENTKIEGSLPWLEISKVKYHYHVVIDQQEDYKRLLRHLTKSAIGLVFSGGGGRVWFHMGVVKAILEKKIPIDAVCGTSSGAGIAACMLLSNSFEELSLIAKNLSKTVRKAIAWYSMTWPIISIYNGKYFTNGLKELFQTQKIEDLKIPYRAISTNINLGTDYLFNQGLLWEAIRATISIPGLFPPVAKDGKILIDGGMINNLPVDEMLNMLHGKGIIIASDNSAFTEDKTYYQFPPVLTLTDFILHKLKIIKQDYMTPSFTDILLKSMLVGSFERYRKNIKLINYYIRSDLSIFHMFITDPKIQAKLFSVGYDQAIYVLNKFKEKEF